MWGLKSYGDYCLPECESLEAGRNLPKFRRNLLSNSSGLHKKCSEVCLKYI
jgi:hypothetical protein